MFNMGVCKTLKSGVGINSNKINFQIAQLLLENDALDFFLKIALHVSPIWKQGKVSQIRVIFR